MAFRKPTIDEKRLLLELGRLAGIKNPTDWTESLLVEEMDDGGMGSLRLQKPEASARDTALVVCKSVVQFTDEDGVEVIASLNANDEGVPIELDIWKTDFSPLVRISTDFSPVKEPTPS